MLEGVRRTIPTRVGRTKAETDMGDVISDHPHAGGENHFTLMGMVNTAGPSPRGWGEQGYAVHSRIAERTIPTRVGRTAG